MDEIAADYGKAMNTAIDYRAQIVVYFETDFGCTMRTTATLTFQMLLQSDT